MDPTAIFVNLTVPQGIFLGAMLIAAVWLIGYLIDLVTLAARLIWPNRLGVDSDAIVEALEDVTTAVQNVGLDQITLLGGVEETLAQIRDAEPT